MALPPAMGANMKASCDESYFIGVDGSLGESELRLVWKAEPEGE